MALHAERPALGTHARARGRFAIVVGGFYEELARRLVDGAQAYFAEVGVELDREIFEVPGAFEVPLGAKYVAESGRFEGVVCLGAVIKGETDHYEHVCRAAQSGIQEVGMRTGVPCAFGVLTCETMEQALERSGGGKRDQGRNAAEAVLLMASMRRALRQVGPS